MRASNTQLFLNLLHVLTVLTAGQVFRETSSSPSAAFALPIPPITRVSFPFEISSGVGGFSGDLTTSRADVSVSPDSDLEPKLLCGVRLWERKGKHSSAVTSTSTSSSGRSDTGGKRKANLPPSKAATSSATFRGGEKVGGAWSTFRDGMMHSMPHGIRHVDRYAILDTLGEGYSGKVKRGRDMTTQQTVALKVMFSKPNDPIENKKFERLQAEVGAMKRCDGHPHVVKLFDPLFNQRYPKRDGTTQAAHVLVMELCQKGELFELLYRGGPVPANISRDYFRQLMSGISHCHSQKVSHRDLKPENLLLDSNFTLKIADFGFAAMERPHMGCQSIVGSRTYMAPEVLSLKVRDYDGYLADVWSAGVILFTMLAGHPPMEKADDSDWWFRALKLGRLDLFWQSHKRTLQNTFSEDAENLISSMLIVTPADRITVREIMEHPYLARNIRRSFTLRHAADPGPSLRAEMHRRYQLAMASKRLCTLTSSSRGTVESAGTSRSGSPYQCGSVGVRGNQGRRHSPFENSVYRGGGDGEDVGPPVMGIEAAARVTGGFMANGSPTSVVKALHGILHEMGAQIAGVQRDGPRTFRTSFKVSAVIPAAPDSGGGDVRIVAAVYRISREGLTEETEREIGEVADLVVVIKRKMGDYYRYLKVEDSLIFRMTSERREDAPGGGVNISPMP